MWNWPYHPKFVTQALQAGHSSQGTSEPITPVRETLGKARGIVYLGVAQVVYFVSYMNNVNICGLLIYLYCHIYL